MKYIRTKERIYDGSLLLREYTGWYFYESVKHYAFHESEIIKTANTIEELIDEYVLVEKSARCFLNYDEITEDDLKLCLQDHDIFGAIWTEKGLIYVAKMNEKGEFELL